MLSDLSNVNVTVLAAVDTAKGEILTNLSALTTIVNNGFADVEFYMAGNFSQVLNQIALTQMLIGMYGDTILNETYNTQAMVAGYGDAILTTLSEVNGTLYAEIETGFGTVMSELGSLAQLINDNTAILNSTINDGHLQILAAIDTALGNLTTLITAEADNLTMTVNDTGMLILQGLFGSSVTLPLSTSIAELIAQSQDAVITAVNTNAVQIKAQLSDNTSAIITAVNDNAANILTAINESTDNLTGSINAVGQSVGNAQTALTTEITNAKNDVLSSIDSLKTQTLNAIDNATTTLNGTVTSTAQQNASATQTFGAVNAVLVVITLILVAYVAFRKLG